MPTNTPKWMTLVIILITLPVFTFPALLDRCPENSEAARTLVWIYPFYMLLSAWLAWKAYPQRSYVSWLLLAVMILSTIAVHALVTL